MTKKKDSPKEHLKKFGSQDKGAVAIVTGLVIVVCIGFAALAIDVTIWYSEKRKLYMAATAGAVGGALALVKTGASTVNANATHDVHLNGCTGANNCTIVAINNPPLSGPKAGNSKSVEVILSKPAELYLSGLFLGSPPTITARAVAGQKDGGNCLLSLANSGVGIKIAGGASYLSSGCNIYVNSLDSKALTLGGGGTLTITDGTINVVGGYTGTPSPTPTTGVSPLSDPFSGVNFPSPPAGCDQTNFRVNNTTETINPGVFCGGIKLVSAAILNMNPGVYFLVNEGNTPGNFDASAQSTINGNGVTIILTKQPSGTKYGEVGFAAGLTANLSPPTTGDTAEFLFYGDKNAPLGTTHKLSGGTSQLLSGIGYFPSSDVDYNGRAFGGGNPCFQLVAQHITLTGSPSGLNNCSTAPGPVVLFE